MKTLKILGLILASLVASATHSRGQPTYTLDPATQINDYLVGSEFSTPTPGGGNQYDAMFTFGDPACLIAGGVLTVTTTGGDPQLLLFPQWPWPSSPPISSIPADMTVVEMRLRVLQGATNGWTFFTGNTPGSLYALNGGTPGNSPFNGSSS